MNAHFAVDVTAMKLEIQETLSGSGGSDDVARLRRQLENVMQDIVNLDLEKQRLEHIEKREAREHEERMARIKLEEMKSAERIKKERQDERKIVESEAQQKINDLEGKCAELEKQLQSSKQRKKATLYVSACVATVAVGIGHYCGTALAFAGTAMGTVAIVFWLVIL